MSTLAGWDTETTGADWNHGSKPFLVTSCVYRENPVWWPWKVNPLTREPQIPESDLDEIAARIKSHDRLVFQNATFDAHAFDSVGLWDRVDVDEFWHKVEDTLLAGHLLASNQPHNLTDMVMHYLGIDIEPFEVEMKEVTVKARGLVRREFPAWALAKEGRADMPSRKSNKAKKAKGGEDESPWKLDTWLPVAYADEKRYPRDHPWRSVTARYANADSESTVMLWVRMEAELRSKGLWDIYRERRRLLPVVYGMERRGVTLSRERLEEMTERYSREGTALGDQCRRIAADLGYDLTLPKSGNNHSLLHFCFGKPVIEEDEETGEKREVGKTDYLKLPVVVRTETGAPSLNKDAMRTYLETLTEGSQLDFVRAVGDKRSRDTAVQYMEGYRRFWTPLGRTGKYYRLCPNLNATGTGTLRFSSSNPNEQNISKKEGFNLRYAFGPLPGREWWPMDYENIELRIPGYEAGEEAMIELFERPDDPPFFGSYHLLNASAMYPDLFWPLAEEKGTFKKRYESTWYKWCKNAGFALIYGCMERKFDQTAHKPGAYKLIKSRLPKLFAMMDRYVAQANRYGHVETIPDRSVCPSRGYPVMCSRTEYGKISPTLPLNYHVQSTAMWCTSKAMVRCEEQLREWRRDGFNAHIALQVHDEIVFDFPAGGYKNLPRAQRLRRLMELSGDDVGVPLRVAMAYCPVSWDQEVSLKARP